MAAPAGSNRGPLHPAVLIEQRQRRHTSARYHELKRHRQRCAQSCVMAVEVDGQWGPDECSALQTEVMQLEITEIFYEAFCCSCMVWDMVFISF